MNGINRSSGTQGECIPQSATMNPHISEARQLMQTTFQRERPP